MSDEWEGGGTDRRRNPERVKELEAQLAAEREKVEGYERLTASLDAECAAERKLLAAERDKSQCVIKDHDAMIAEALAAEREAIKVLVDALREVESYFSRRTVSFKLQETVRSALAKVVEK